jgi:hypothetical protein
MKRLLSIASVLAISHAAFLPQTALAQTSFGIVINTAPPAPRFESVPAARHGQVWAPGYWNWQGDRHVWSGGHWEGARDGYLYQPSEWIRDAGGYRLREGGWQVVAQRGYDEIRIAPPPPRWEAVPRPRHGYVWAPGYWDWRGNRHEWIVGSWIAERAGYNYVAPAWQQRDGRWFMEASRWNERGRDRDHDGIPDRYERHGARQDRDHDGIPDRYERRGERRDGDRDGDGVPNGRDYRPDNPYRH